MTTIREARGPFLVDTLLVQLAVAYSVCTPHNIGDVCTVRMCVCTYGMCSIICTYPMLCGLLSCLSVCVRTDNLKLKHQLHYVKRLLCCFLFLSRICSANGVYMRNCVLPYASYVFEDAYQRNEDLFIGERRVLHMLTSHVKYEKVKLCSRIFFRKYSA